jgi:hypothetical protein
MKSDYFMRLHRIHWDLDKNFSEASGIWDSFMFKSDVFRNAFIKTVRTENKVQLNNAYANLHPSK